MTAREAGVDSSAVRVNGFNDLRIASPVAFTHASLHERAPEELPDHSQHSTDSGDDGSTVSSIKSFSTPQKITLAKLLVAKGADPNIQDNQKK